MSAWTGTSSLVDGACCSSLHVHMHAHCSTLAHRSTLPLMLTCLAAISPGFWATEVIGDFKEGDARKFLEETLRLERSSVTVDDNAWAKVYEVLHP